MTTLFFNAKVKPRYEAWQSSNADLCILSPACPQFSARVTLMNGCFIIETWQTSHVSVQGCDSVQQWLRCAGVVKLTKQGDLSARVVKLSPTDKWVMRQAHAAWIAAGSPAEFVYIA